MIMLGFYFQGHIFIPHLKKQFDFVGVGRLAGVAGVTVGQGC